MQVRGKVPISLMQILASCNRAHVFHGGPVTLATPIWGTCGLEGGTNLGGGQILASSNGAHGQPYGARASRRTLRHTHTQKHTHTRLFVASGHVHSFSCTLICGPDPCLLRWLCMCGGEGEGECVRGRARAWMIMTLQKRRRRRRRRRRTRKRKRREEEEGIGGGD